MHVLNPLRILPLVSRRVEDLRFACLWSAELVPWCCWLRVGLEIRLEVEVEDRMAHHHFVLIHGGCYGAWAWCKLEDCLQRKGCKVTALDMTGAGIHPADPDSITTYEEYHQPALIFFESVPEGNLDKVNLDSLQLSAARTELRIWTHASNAFDSLQIVVSADEQGVNLLRIYRSDAAKRYRHA